MGVCFVCVHKKETEEQKDQKRIQVENRLRLSQERVCAPYFIQLYCVPLLWFLLSLALSDCDLTGDTVVCMHPASHSRTEH